MARDVERATRWSAQVIAISDSRQRGGRVRVSGDVAVMMDGLSTTAEPSQSTDDNAATGELINCACVLHLHHYTYTRRQAAGPLYVYRLLLSSCRHIHHGLRGSAGPVLTAMG